MLTGKFKEGKQQRVKISGITSEVFQSITEAGDGSPKCSSAAQCMLVGLRQIQGPGDYNRHALIAYELIDQPGFT